MHGDRLCARLLRSFDDFDDIALYRSNRVLKQRSTSAAIAIAFSRNLSFGEFHLLKKSKGKSLIKKTKMKNDHKKLK